jgi:hypothetical protein
MTKKTAVKSSPNGRRDDEKLDSRYGRIGISAVAAALQYQGAIKSSAPAPVVSQRDEQVADAAA